MTRSVSEISLAAVMHFIGDVAEEDAKSSPEPVTREGGRGDEAEDGRSRDDEAEGGAASERRRRYAPKQRREKMAGSDGWQLAHTKQNSAFKYS